MTKSEAINRFRDGKLKTVRKPFKYRICDKTGADIYRMTECVNVDGQFIKYEDFVEAMKV